MITDTPTKGLNTFFEESITGKHKARSIWLDLEAESIDKVWQGMYRQLF
jgi:hypothetical protein